MTTTLVDELAGELSLVCVVHHSTDEALDTLTHIRTLKRQAALAEFQAAAEYAELSGRELMVDDDGRPRHGAMHGERLVRIAGEGSPLVAEFAALEVGAAMRMSKESAFHLMRHALAVKHRLPGVWFLVKSLRLEVWQARDIADVTEGLTADQAEWVDARLAPTATGMSHRRLLRHARALVAKAVPDEATRDRDAARRGRRVRVDATTNGATAFVLATLDAVDAKHLDARLSQLAAILKTCGDGDDLDVRRSKALGLLASPARALQLLQASAAAEAPALVDDGALDVECPARGQRGHTCGTITVDPELLLPRAELVVHLSDHTLELGESVEQNLMRARDLGPQLVGWARDLLGHQRVTLRPVLQVDALMPSDAYEVPERMREAITMRNPVSVFPFSTRRASRCDLDHTVPYRPPDDQVLETEDWLDRRQQNLHQTRTDNLGPLDRKAHRAKTFADWQVSQPVPGCFLWTSPKKYRYLVTPSGTISLGRTGGGRAGEGLP
ncbi:DUF222 domain-containing protein [Aestuariimicrobium soli]|uniref:DUF222 domain-containing protein n=1 Tax=Aestuariimicrobium soli TaxID=2035834 RepID=UPI003EC11F99